MTILYYYLFIGAVLSGVFLYLTLDYYGLEYLREDFHNQVLYDTKVELTANQFFFVYVLTALVVVTLAWPFVCYAVWRKWK